MYMMVSSHESCTSCKSCLLRFWPPNLIHKALDNPPRHNLVTPPHPDPANLFHSLLRSKIRHPNHKDNSLNKPERMIQHQPLQFPVVMPTPVSARQKRPPNLNHTLLRVKSKVARRPNRLPRLPINNHKRTPSLQSLSKELPEHILPKPIPSRMLLPNQRIRSHCE